MPPAAGWAHIQNLPCLDTLLAQTLVVQDLGYADEIRVRHERLHSRLPLDMVMALYLVRAVFVNDSIALVHQKGYNLVKLLVYYINVATTNRGLAQDTVANLGQDTVNGMVNTME